MSGTHEFDRENERLIDGECKRFSRKFLEWRNTHFFNSDVNKKTNAMFPKNDYKKTPSIYYVINS